MRLFSVFRVVLFVVFFSITAFAQTPRSTPPEETDVVKISTTLIQVDATVTDKDGNIVKDLKPEDFEIYENGRKQNISNFSFIGKNSDAARNNESQPKKTDQEIKKEKILNPLPPVRVKPEQVRRTYAMVVDDLGLSFASADYVKDTLRKFINEQMQDGDLVAIIRVGSGLGALQSFTSDKRQLLAAVDKIRWNGMSRTGVYSYEPFRLDLLDNIGLEKMKGVLDETRVAINKDIKEMLVIQEAERRSNLAVGALGAVNYVIRSMSDLPGRKSLMLFSEGFELLNYLDKSDRTGVPKTTKTAAALKLLAAAANRASVVIYTFDPRGLVPLGIEAVDEVDVEGRGGGSDRFSGRTIRENIIRDTKDSLKLLAAETGGLAYVDLNKMEIGVKKALDDQNGYYLLGYQPDEETFDVKKSKFNKLEIRLKQPDLKIRYRSGFFGITDENLKREQTPSQRFNEALTSPFGSSEINLDLYSIFYNEGKDKNYIRSFMRIDADDLKFARGNDGKYRATVDIGAMTFGDNGAPVDQILKSYTIELYEQDYQKTLQTGFVYDFLLPVKKPGAYQFRIALRDEGTQKIGAASQFIEVPDIDKNKLALSNILLKNYSVSDWQTSRYNTTELPNTRIFLDSTSREFKRGTVLNYLFEIYSAQPLMADHKLQSQMRLIYDGKVVLEGNPATLNLQGQSNLQKIEISKALALGNDLKAGNYVLQLFVVDNSSNGEKRIASQAVDFEITE